MNGERREGRASGIGPIDYALVLVGAAVAVWCAGESINVRDISLRFSTIVMGGTLFSFGVRWLGRGKRWLALDGWLYTAVCAFVLFNANTLNGTLPEEGFPRQIGAAGFLSWSLAFGSFLLWRDQTLLFQAIPAMALFGLCGCFDTYPALPYFFFIFLVCLATLFARAHNREMLLMARASGFGGDLPEDSPVLSERIRRGPWRWVAGPEWALLSALAVVLLSLLGAPVIQSSVQGVAGIIPIVRPTISPRAQPGLGVPANQETVTVGRGPNDSLTKTPLYEVSMEEFNYLRTSVYPVWVGRGWSLRGFDQGRGYLPALIDSIVEPVERNFLVRTIVPLAAIPTPGEVVDWGRRRPDGTRDGTYTVSRVSAGLVVQGKFVASKRPELAVDARRDVPREFVSMLPASPVDPRVVAFARNAASGGKNDRERAELVRAAIAAQARYNLRAAAVPAGEDPAAWFLFEGKEGYCDLYATAMTLGARAIGLPARYVQGFLPDAKNRDGAGNWIVLDSDYHAWCEIWLEGAGWVPFDATGGTQEVEGSGRGDPTDDEELARNALYQTILNVVIGGLTLGMIGMGVVAFLRRGAPVPDDRRTARELQAKLHRGMEKARRRRRGPGETTRAMATGLDVDPTLVDGLEAAIYGPGPRPDDEAGSLTRAVEAALHALRQRPS